MSHPYYYSSLSHLSLLITLLLSLLSSLQGTKESHDHDNDPALQQSMAMDPYERETLFHVMEAMSSDRDWRSSNPDPCTSGSSWPGMECKPGLDNHLHVTRLDFGAAPNPTCRTAATFPSQVFDLPYLQSLFFFNCFRSSRTNLSLPPPTSTHRAAAYASLQQLSLKSNPSLVGTIPSHVSSLTSLQVLTLSQNQLSGKIPKSISELSSLVHLDLSYNSLSGSIPSQIDELKKLVGLDLSYNSLTGMIPSSMGQLSLLQKLDLSSNGLVGRIPESLGNLTFLAFLALSNNKLSGELPDSLTKLQNLQYLIMDDNPMFVTLPSQLGRLAKLQELRIANSGYSGTIPDSFGWLTNLTSLSLENNRLTGVIPAGLSGLGRIYHLNLSRNFLSGVVPFSSGFLERLGKNLDLSGNPGLCFRSSDESDVIGVDKCGGANTGASSLQKSSGRSSGALLMFCKFYCQLIGFLAFWSGYY